LESEAKNSNKIMESLSDSLLQNDMSARNYQNYSPATSCSPSGSTYSFSSSPNTSTTYSRQHTYSESLLQQSNKRRTSEPVIQYDQHYKLESAEPYGLDSSNSDEQNTSSTGFHGYARPVNRFFPDGVVDILNKWFYENQNYPYPDDNMTNILAKEANISPKQVRKWFANKRVRSNKCYKQTFRIRKDPMQQSKCQLNRRQTKSVSDTESLQMQQSCFYNNDLDDECNRSPDTSDHKPFIWQDQVPSHLSSSGSSASSSPPSFTASSPINNKHNNELNAHYFRTSQSLNNFNAPVNFSEHSQQASRVNQSPYGMYNPYLLMNLLQNPSMALQAILANRLISLNNNNTNTNCNQEAFVNSVNDQICDPNSSQQAAAKVEKRKSHLSNRFLNESFKSTNLDLIQEVAYVKDEESLMLQHQEVAKYYLKNSTESSQNSTCSNEKSMRSALSLDELSSVFNNSASMNFNQLVTQKKEPSTQMESRKSTKKINFSDISSLI